MRHVLTEYLSLSYRLTRNVMKFNLTCHLRLTTSAKRGNVVELKISWGYINALSMAALRATVWRAPWTSTSRSSTMNIIMQWWSQAMPIPYSKTVMMRKKTGEKSTDWALFSLESRLLDLVGNLVSVKRYIFIKAYLYETN